MMPGFMLSRRRKLCRTARDATVQAQIILGHLLHRARVWRMRAPRINRARGVLCYLAERRRKRYRVVRRHEPAVDAVLDDFRKAADAAANDGSADRLRLERDGWTSFETNRGTAEHVVPAKHFPDLIVRDRFGKAHASVAGGDRFHPFPNCPLRGALNRSSEFDDERYIWFEQCDSSGEHLNAFDHVEPADVSDADRAASCATAIDATLDRHANTEPVDEDVSVSNAVRVKDLPRTIGQDHEMVRGCKEFPLAFDVVADHVAHSDRRSDRPRDSRGTARQPIWHVPDGTRNCAGHSTGIQHASGALSGLRHTVAGPLTPLHERPARADEPEAARVRRDHSLRTQCLRSSQLGQAHARHERVHMDDVGALGGEPSMKALGTANGLPALRFRARRPSRNWIPVNRRAIVKICPLMFRRGIGSRDEDLVPRGLERTAQRGDIDFRPAEGFRKVPSDRLDDSQSCSTHPNVNR